MKQTGLQGGQKVEFSKVGGGGGGGGQQVFKGGLASYPAVPTSEKKAGTAGYEAT